MEAVPVEGLQADWVDACLLLLWPPEGPCRRDAAQRRCGDAGSGDGAGAEEQDVVHLGESLPGVGVEAADGGDEEAFLVGPRDRAVAVGPVAQVGKVPQQPSQVCRRPVDLAVKRGGLTHDSGILKISFYRRKGGLLMSCPESSLLALNMLIWAAGLSRGRLRSLQRRLGADQ